MAFVAVDARMGGSSGIGVYFRNVFFELAKISPEWQFCLFGLPESITEFNSLKNVSSRNFSAKIYSVREQIEFPRLLGQEFSALWSPHYNIPIFSRVPQLVTVHDIAHLAEPKARGGIIRQLYARLVFEMVRRKAKGICFVSQFSRAEFSRVIGDPRGGQYITPNAPAKIWRDAGLFPSDIRPMDRKYIIYVGNVKPHKNLQGLLNAFALLKDRTDLDLVIVGKKDGFLHGDNETEQYALKFGERVHFTGQISDAELIDWVRHAVALVFPSFYEGFGIPPLEAMAVGCPAVVSDIPALRETCGDAAIYFDPFSPEQIAAALESVSNDTQKRSSLIESGYKRQAEYDFSIAAAVVKKSTSGCYWLTHVFLSFLVDEFADDFPRPSPMLPYPRWARSMLSWTSQASMSSCIGSTLA